MDGVAEVEIRGDSATLRNLSGQPPQWRRFECNAPMPANPGEFRFAGVDGRGSQQLVRDPRNGGSAVVRIEDRDNGSEGYTFDIFWGGGGRNYTGQDRGGPPPQQDRGGFGPPPREQDRGFNGPPPRDSNRDRGFGQDRRFTTDQAIRACQDWVRDDAGRRLATSRIDFQRTAMDDNPGRNDWFSGTSPWCAVVAVRIFTASRAQSTLTRAVCGRRTSVRRTGPTGNAHVIMLACNCGLRSS